ncbi:nucleotide pyrophosphatase [archaeon SCG-AAA382B04]|nr:nucleotide pyrophosphatase [archaeon SCG-AAA382B04]
MTKTIVVGLDGANWDLIEPWLESDELPNIEKLRDGGCFFDSISCLPTVTFPNWKCYSTGKNPGKLGVYWFEGVDVGNRELTRPDSNSFKSAEYWDYLDKEGIRTGVLNMPTTYPPKEVDGFMVCGGPDAKEGESRHLSSGYTYPEELEEYLEDEWSYRIHPSPLLSSQKERGEEVEAILDLIEKRFDVAMDLLEKEDVDFLHLTVFYLNVLQHFFWRDKPTKRAWKLIDKKLGELLERYEDINLVLMSDHGCGKIDTQFFINRWLEQNNYLKTKKSIDDFFKKIGLTRENALKIAKKLNLVDFLAKNVPDRIQRLIPMEEGAIRERKLEKIDWKETDAIASGQGPIYLTKKGREKKEEIKKELKKLKSSLTDEKIAKDVHEASEIYHGDELDKAPDLIVEERPGVTISDRVGEGEVFKSPGKWSTENTRKGLALFYGQECSNETERDEVSILDLAPTILNLLGVKIPNDVDGEVIKEIFEEGKEIEYQKPIEDKGEKTLSEEEEIASRLQSLGYMD